MTASLPVPRLFVYLRRLVQAGYKVSRPPASSMLCHGYHQDSSAWTVLAGLRIFLCVLSSGLGPGGSGAADRNSCLESCRRQQVCAVQPEADRHVHPLHA